MPAFVKIVKPSAKRSDNSEIEETGKFEILDTFNMNLLLKTSISEKFASSIANVLNSYYMPQYVDGDIVALTCLIRKYLKDWIEKNPEGEYNNAVNCVLGQIMRDSKGHVNPNLVETLIKHERKVWENSKSIIPC